MIVWVDVETSGLNESTGHLLEVAMVATDDNLVERGATSVVVKPVGLEMSDIFLPLVVREMHEKSGLLADLQKEETFRRHEGEQFLLNWLEETFGSIDDLKQIPLAGSTVDFDRRWLRHHMLKIDRLFSYRSINVSSLTELAARWEPKIYNDRPKHDKGTPHRALEDVRMSIELLRYYKRRGFVGGVFE